ncbi:WD domain G-beta repeat protein [Myxococcus xanthus DK 1622]|uniref:WD domain G-beta repeat protein n=2 Tax=Myxococcaceae TaxID=31 RepID=Q1D137_MYXXD|nr:WD domain G-beta repeat protein [Myxococcus xanthus DK 1622]NOJ55473.1 High-affnity carbon uptake protein Hat/HatR [Myxococcus xanthus]QPM77933.1 trypsin-like peptidase domain-containing protein [Myxococcus xanthus]QVW67000.1 trypsin-like peptidase domain-containing protein [Myxococcus xanthus DZ2]UEO06872.1 trypsin-like peptidase domain-containing protein [Myxococcus xanthus DZ2]
MRLESAPGARASFAHIMKGSDLREGVVRVLSRDRQRVLGTGFLVTERLVVTCWHVLDTLSDSERDAICLEVLQSHEKATARLRLDASSPTEVADLAVLTLTRPLRGPSTPLPLGSAERSADHRFATFGFPRGFDDTGTWARGTIGYATGDGDFRKLLLHGSDIREGFSGAPLFDEQTRRVVGVVRFKAVASEAREAYATPTEQLLARCPELRASEDCPYRDLASFRESDARFWKGRGRVLDEQLLPLLARLPRFVEVSGPSGSGKSSLLHAGLIPALRDGTFIPGSQHWDVRALRPGLEPFAALDGAGLPAGEGLVARVQAWRAANPEPGKRLVLVIDSLEDVLLRGSSAELAQQQRFLQQLSALADESLPVTCVVALREGFDAVLSERAPRLRTLLGEHRVQVPSVLTPSELRDIIAGPAREVGLRFDPPEVVDSIALAAQEEFRAESGAGARVTVLPLLEVALTQLWQASRDGAMTLEAFNASAGLLGSLARWADSVYEPLKPSERLLANRLLLELVQLGEADSGLEDKGRRVPLEVLRGRLGEQAEVDAVLQVLVNGRLLVTAQDGHRQRETVELIHDALLTHWQRFVKLRTEDRAFRRWHEAVQADAERWWEAERAQQRQEAEHRLLRGEALTRAQAMVTLHPYQTSALAQRYVLRGQEAERSRYGRARRNLWLALGASVSALVGVSGFYLRAVDSEKQAVAAKNAAEIAVTAEAATSKQLSLQLRISQADSVVSLSRSPGREVEALTQAIQLAGSPPTGADAAQDEVTQALTEAIAAFLYSAPLSTELEARTVGAFSPDSRHLLTRGVVLTPSMRFVSRLWDVRTASLLREFESVDLCPKGALVECTDALYADISGEDTHAFGFSPGDGTLWLGGRRGTLFRWSHQGAVPSIPDAHQDRITAISFSDSGDRVLSASRDRTVKLWDANTGRTLRELTFQEPCTQAVLSGDSRYAWVGGEELTCLYDLTSDARLIRCITTHDPGPSVAFSPSSRLAVLGDRRGEVSLRLLELPSGQDLHRPLTKLEGHALMPSFEDECSLSAFDDTFSSALTVRFCDSGPGNATGSAASPRMRTRWRPIPLHGRLFENGRRAVDFAENPVGAHPFIRVPQATLRWMFRQGPLESRAERALVAPDGRTLLAQAEPGLTRKTIDISTWNEYVPGGFAVSKDLRWMVVREPQSGQLSLVDRESSSQTALGACDVEGVYPPLEGAFSHDGQFLAVRCGVNVRFWDVAQANRGPRTQPPPIEAGINLTSLPAHWRWRHVTPTEDHATESFLASPRTRAHLQRTEVPGDGACQTQRTFSQSALVEFAPSGRYFAIGDERSVYLGSARDCRLTREAPLAASAITSQGASFSPDGERFVTISNVPESSAIWESATGTKLAPLPTSLGAVVMAFSPDSKYFAVANHPDVYWMGQAYLLDATNGEKKPLAAIDGKVKALSFSPDTSRLVAVTDDAIHLFDPNSGALVRRIDVSTDIHVKVRHAQARFGVSDTSGKLHFWRTSDGRHVAELHQGYRSGLEMEPDEEGTRIATFDSDGAYVFSLRPDDLLRQACALMRGRREYAPVQSICDTFLLPAVPLADLQTP